MALIYPLSFPTAPGPERARLTTRNVVASSTSPYSLESQTQRHQGQLWMVDLTMPPLQGDKELGEWAAFLTSLRGRWGSFTWAPPDRNRGSLLGTPVVDGASQTGEELDTKGWTASELGVLKAGDLIQIGTGGSTRLYRVLQDADSDASGLATLDIWPRLRSSPADGATITTANAAGLWRMSDNAASMMLEPALIARVQFTIEEYL